MANEPPRDIALEERQRKGARMSSPSAGRNSAAISQTLARLLPDGAHVLEIASGTGEHALACVRARPDLLWRPSEPDPGSRASVDGWALDSGGRMLECLEIDVAAPDWETALDPCDAVFCANMIHITPWEAAEGLFRGAGALLKPDGALHLYGPFKEGAATAPSNLDFDVSLKSRDPRWGVRDIEAVDALGRKNGLSRAGRIAMPANNLVLTYVRSRP